MATATAAPLFEVITGASFTLVTVTVRACVITKVPSLTCTSTLYTLLRSASKLGAFIKLNAPAASIVNKAASAPPLIEKACVAPASWSVAVTVSTTVVFSATLTAAAEVITGASFTLVTVTANACVSTKVPSLTCTTTSYTLLPAALAGASKLGAATKLNTPVVALMLNSPASAPPLIEKASV